jgi:hypothetical protein
MRKTIQRIELKVWYHSPIHCPFCGMKIIEFDADGVESPFIGVCEHTLFVAHDEGFEYRSVAFDKHLGFEGLDDDAIQEKGGPDELTDQITIPDAIKFAAYVGPPSSFGSYVGFDPGAEHD